MKIYVMKFFKYIKMCMLLNRTRILEIVQELDVAKCTIIMSILLLKMIETSEKISPLISSLNFTRTNRIE